MFNLEQAIARAKDNGREVTKKAIALKLWPATDDERCAVINMSKLCTGKLKRICPEWVPIICDMCGCDPNFLFGYVNESR